MEGQAGLLFSIRQVRIVLPGRKVFRLTNFAPFNGVDLYAATDVNVPADITLKSPKSK
jgi:hypothetical protein